MNVCTGMIMYTLYSIAPLRVWYIRRERGEVAEILYVISAIVPPPRLNFSIFWGYILEDFSPCLSLQFHPPKTYTFNSTNYSRFLIFRRLPLGGLWVFSLPTCPPPLDTLISTIHMCINNLNKPGIMHQGVSKPIPHLHPLASPPSPSPPPPPASPLFFSLPLHTVQCAVNRIAR